MPIELGGRLAIYDLEGKNRDRLIEVGQILEPHLDKVLDNFYANAMSHPIAAAMFKDPAILNHARSAQKKHWANLMCADFGESYRASCERVGRTHYRIDLPFELYFSSYARAASELQTTLINAASRTSRALAPQRLSALLGALTRALALDNDMVIQAYFEAQSEELNNAFSYVEKGLDGLEHGDLSLEINQMSAPDFPVKYDSVRQSWNNGLGNLGTAIHALSAGLGQVQEVTARIDSAADGLSTRAANQAASLEETSAAMQQLAESVSENATNAREADQVSRAARSQVEDSAKVMTDTATAMGKIQKASEEITTIIGMIDDISFQTNLLALNAGVEAARAGEAGRGFAVVASEVRNLAVSSSNAAQQIKKLIERSSSQVDEGVQLVDSAETMLKNVAGKFDSVAQLASAVADTTAEQSISLREVTTAVAQMDQITQQNAGMAQDSSDEARALVGHVEALNMRLDAFRLPAGQQINAAFAA